MLSKRPPPEFRSRSVQWQLFVLVAGLMTVLIAMNEARKPSTWSWLWNGQNQADQDAGCVDTRLPPQPELVDSRPITVYAERTPQRSPGIAQDKSDQDPSAATRSVADVEAVSMAAESSRNAWGTVWSTLSNQEQQQLMRGLRTVRLGTSATAIDSQEWQSLLTKLDQSWNELFADRNKAILMPQEEVTEERKRSSLLRWSELEIAWNSKWKPALSAVGTTTATTAEQRRGLAELEESIEAIGLADVQDDTVWRADERTAWFGLVERLQTTSEAKLRQQSLGNVGFVQIFRQSREYRGKVVTVRGTARLTYRVPAPRNDLGVRDYYLFWIQPEDGSNLPIVVYALHPPTGFPDITTEQRKIQEPMEVTGYFFKRWVYRAADGLNSVPLVLTNAPTWHPLAAPTRTASQRFSDALGAFYWPVIALGIAGLAVAAYGFAWLANWSSRPSAALTELRAKSTEIASSSWDHLPATPSIEESLRKIEGEKLDGDF